MLSQNQRPDFSFAQVAWNIITSHYLILSHTIWLLFKQKPFKVTIFFFFPPILTGIRFQYDSSGGSTVVTDLPNSVENLLLQVSCSWLGAAVATAKDGIVMERMGS